MKPFRAMLVAVALSTTLLLVSPPAWAVSTTLWKVPQELSLEDTGFRLQAPPGISVKAIKTDAEVLSYDKITPVDDFYVTRAVEISMVDSDKLTVHRLSKPVNLSFSFNYIDFKRASRLNTSLPVGRFRIGYWDASNNSWLELPSRLFWNGADGVIEAESDYGTGQYALLWSYRGDAALSPMAEPGIRIMLNYTPIRPDVAPYNNGGRTMVPVRVVAENLGARVDWDKAEQRIDIVRNVEKVRLWVGKPTALVRGESILIDAPPEIVEGRTFVPLRFVAETFGIKVDWDEGTKTVHLIAY